MDINGIIDKLTPRSRSRFEAYAEARGITIQEAVESRLKTQLTSEELAGLSGAGGGGGTRWDDMKSPLELYPEE